MEDQLLVCRAAETYIGFRLKFVQEVVLAAALETVPECPPELLGLLNYHGELAPVISVEFLAGSEKDKHHDVLTSDHFVILQLPDDPSGARLAGVLINSTVGIFNAAQVEMNRINWGQAATDATLRWPASVLLSNQVVHLPELSEVLTPEAKQAFQLHLDHMSG